jgi:hypothetical protein
MQRHCEHLPASTVNDYIEQLIMMNDGMDPLVPPAPVPPQGIPSRSSFYLLVF